MNYDKAIKTFHNMHPEYDTANIGTYCLHDIILDALKTAKKEHELMNNIQATILDCISLLSVSGENTKAIVAEKLKGLI